MAVKQQQSRLEANREIRRVLVKNGVDTTKLHYSCHGRMISLSGGIYKEGGKDLPTSNIESIFAELTRMGFHFNCDLDNWVITEGSISKKAAKASSTMANAGEEQKRIVITDDDL